jgi:glycosyltransferase involved in cell wall biosynthesis
MNGISIVVPSTGNIPNIKSLLQSIEQQDSEGIEIKVIIVLNGVSNTQFDDFKRSADSFSVPVTVCRIFERGVNRARNLGLDRAEHETVLFLDDDCELMQEGTLKAHLKFHDRFKNIFAVGGGYRLKDSSGLFDDIYNYIQMNWFISGQGTERDGIADANYLLGGNFSLKKSMALSHHLRFDPGIVYGGSELDFFKQATKAGLKLAAIDLDVLHNTHETFFSVGKKVLKQGKGKRLIDLKFGREQGQEIYTPGKEHQFFRFIYSYWFWFGYYGVTGERFKIFGHLFRDVFGYLNALRFRILKKINS